MVCIFLMWEAVCVSQCWMEGTVMNSHWGLVNVECSHICFLPIIVDNCNLSLLLSTIMCLFMAWPLHWISLGRSLPLLWCIDSGWEGEGGRNHGIRGSTCTPVLVSILQVPYWDLPFQWTRRSIIHPQQETTSDSCHQWVPTLVIDFVVVVIVVNPIQSIE